MALAGSSGFTENANVRRFAIGLERTMSTHNGSLMPCALTFGAPGTIIDKATGEVMFGRFQGFVTKGRLGRPRWVRAFHVDAPHAGYPFYHLNANAGLFECLGYNHARLPKWTYTAGTERVMRGAGKAFIVVGIAMDTYNIVTADRCDRAVAIGGAIGGWAGGLAVGVALGSVVPGVGTIVGGVVGGIIGGLGGEWLGNAIGKPADCP